MKFTKRGNGYYTKINGIEFYVSRCYELSGAPKKGWQVRIVGGIFPTTAATREKAVTAKAKELGLL